MTQQENNVPTGKRERLIQAARRSYHQRGMAESTLKVIAAEANVPLGNVYYYFPTKDDLTLAVLRDTQSDLRDWLATFEHHPDPRERLVAYLEETAQQADRAADYGCPVALLASEMHRQGAPASKLGAEALLTFQDWFTTQLSALPTENPELAAEELFAAVQGAYAIAHGTQNADLFTRLLSRLREQVRQLPSP